MQGEPDSEIALIPVSGLAIPGQFEQIALGIDAPGMGHDDPALAEDEALDVVERRVGPDRVIRVPPALASDALFTAIETRAVKELAMCPQILQIAVRRDDASNEPTSEYIGRELLM